MYIKRHFKCISPHTVPIFKALHVICLTICPVAYLPCSSASVLGHEVDIPREKDHEPGDQHDITWHQDDIPRHEDDIPRDQSDIPRHQRDIIWHEDNIIWHEDDITGHQGNFPGDQRVIIGNEDFISGKWEWRAYRSGWHQYRPPFRRSLVENPYRPRAPVYSASR